MSLEYITDTLGALHPDATVGPSVSDESVRYLVIPSAARPALVLPADSSAQAASACRSYAKPQGVRARGRTAILAGVFASGLGNIVFRDHILVGPSRTPGLDEILSELLNAEVALAFPVGKVRSNRKPVVQAISETGVVLAFVKLGVDDLTDALVEHEAAALGHLGSLDLGIVRIPRLLAAGEWHGRRFLVSEALAPTKKRRSDSGQALIRAMRDLARADGVSRGPFAELAWWGGVTRAVETLPSTAPALRLQRVCAELATIGQSPVAGGSWHGDWNRGNFAVQGDGVLVWDWERFTQGVPLGWDALHLALGEIVPRGGAPTPQRAAQLMSDVSSLIRPLGAAPGTEALVAALYLVELGTRMLADRQAELGVAMGAIDRWLLPVLEPMTQRLVAGFEAQSPLGIRGAEA